MSHFSHSAGGVVLNEHGEVLVVGQRDGSWSLPKGTIQEGEGPQAAAVREIAEESGLTALTCVKILKSYSRYSLSNTGNENMEKIKRITMYLFTTIERDLRPMDPRISAARWVSKEQVAAMLTHPRDKDFF